MHTGRPARLKGFDYRGCHCYFLTFCTRDRRQVFVSPEFVACVLSQFRRAATQSGIALIAYCFMPDHVHLLVEGTSEDSDGRRFISLAKQLSGYHFSKQFGCGLWQHYGFERVLRSEESTLAVAQYILANPVRAQLCETPSDYPFLGSDVYSVKEIVDSVQLWSPG